jgi:hypothetical protein
MVHVRFYGDWQRFAYRLRKFYFRKENPFESENTQHNVNFVCYTKTFEFCYAQQSPSTFDRAKLRPGEIT